MLAEEGYIIDNLILAVSTIHQNSGLYSALLNEPNIKRVIYNEVQIPGDELLVSMVKEMESGLV